MFPSDFRILEGGCYPETDRTVFCRFCEYLRNKIQNKNRLKQLFKKKLLDDKVICPALSGSLRVYVFEGKYGECNFGWDTDKHDISIYVI